MDKKIAIVIGATGLVGSHLVQNLLNDERFSAIKIFTRRPSGFKNEKITEHIINFDEPSVWQNRVIGDVLFSALGTTIKKAGSRQAQYKIDHNYQYNVAKAASDNKVPVYVLVSAALASENAVIFYSRMKGELERDIKLLPFQYIHIFQPGLLGGNRKERRPIERFSISFVQLLNKIGIARSQTPVDPDILSMAMINVSFHNAARFTIYTLPQILIESDK